MNNDKEILEQRRKRLQEQLADAEQALRDIGGETVMKVMKNEIVGKNGLTVFELRDLWKALYDRLDTEETDEIDYQSMCIGFCLAHETTLDFAYDFYQWMIKLDLF